MVAMMASMGSVMAAAVVGEYVTVASVTETFDDGSYTITELSILQPDSRIGFSGTISGRVEKTYYANGGYEAAHINANAVFSSTAGQNVCNFDYGFYSTYNFAGGSLTQIHSESESHVSNQGVGPFTKYAEYKVTYSYPGRPNKRPSIWIKCTANGDISTGRSAGDITLAENEVVVGDMVVSFG